MEGPNKNEVFGRISDLEISPIEYYKLVADFNLLLQRELSETLNKNSGSLGSLVTFVTPGSDARLEKGSFMSPLEVVAITDADLDLDKYQEELLEIVNRISPTPIAKVIEMKGPSSSLVTAYGRYQPGRMADARLIYGEDEALKRTKTKLGEEILNLSADEVDKIAALKRQGRKVTETGINRLGGMEAMHFDLASGSVFYNPTAYQLSFKIGPLRLVQNTLLIEEVKHTRRTGDKDFISTLDASIVNRLNQLSGDRMVNISQSAIDEASEHYAYFLRLYHRSERAYAESGQITLQLTPKEIAEVSKRLQALSELMAKFQIQKQPSK